MRYYVFNDPNELTRKYVMIRLGYRYFSVLSGDATSEEPSHLGSGSQLLLAREHHVDVFENRFDFRFFVTGVFAFQYRARLRLEREFRLGWGAIAPYVADEVFYDARFSAWVRNRLSAGVGLVDLIANGTTLDLGYIWQVGRLAGPTTGESTSSGLTSRFSFRDYSVRKVCTRGRITSFTPRLPEPGSGTAP